MIMNKRTTSILILIILLTSTINAQKQPYTVTKTQFCNDLNDEFAPAYYKNGLVFCTDRGQAVNSQGQRTVKMYYADTISDNRSAKLFSKDLKTKLNDGPATFSKDDDTIYFSRNLVVEGNLRMLSTYRNKLGLFFAVAEEKGWSRVREMRFNTEWFNITMPCLSHDGKRLYFASDKPDGIGGLDIYYSNWKNGYWEDPVNLGPTVNTEKNETYPFISETGELFFSSDGHPGLGGKDIFVTKQHGSDWYPPVRLNAPVNSEYDDFGLITNPTMNEGYFSSNRGKSIDIYKFKSEIQQVWFSEPQKENHYCFTISDTGKILIDTLKLKYVWNFGDNSKMTGTKVKHCFPGPGRYKIDLDIIDRNNGRLYFRKLAYDLELLDYEQPYITSPDYAVAGEAIEFDGMKSYCPGYTITGFYWDFGDGTQKTGAGPVHTYTKAGEYKVRLGLMLKSQTSGDVLKKAVTKTVRIFKDRSERDSYFDAKPASEEGLEDIRQYENVMIKDQYSAEAELLKEAAFQVEILSSASRLEMTNPIFRSVPSKYTIKEVHYPETGLWSYVVDQEMTLMAAWPAYNEMINSGYRGATVKLYVLKDPAERELNILKRNYGVMTDTYFDANNRLVTNAYLMLDQVVMLMNKYPGLKIEIGVHTDNQGTVYSQQTQTQNRAEVIMNYLINRGISSSRLTARGYGSTRPVASNATWLERRQNRRVDFSVIN
jgi:outer membrane protein OmpA-like peptidoglycan-associated protein